MVREPELKIFAGNANPRLASAVAEQLGIPLIPGRVARFSDQEIRLSVDESVRGDDIFIIQPTCAPVNDHLMELLIALDAFRRTSASRITAVIPYFGYARQDKKLKPREPISAKLVANLITAAGANRVLTLDLHALQIQGYFDFPVDHLPVGPIIADHLISEGLYNSQVVVVSPDVGGVARARAFADRLDSDVAIVVKRRPEPNKVEVLEVIGDVKGRTCIMVDDMIDTAGSLVCGANALFDLGAEDVYACATHGVLSGSAVERLQESPIKQVVVTDTIPVPDSKRIQKMKVLSVAPYLAEAIRSIHEERSVSTLISKNWKSA